MTTNQETISVKEYISNLQMTINSLKDFNPNAQVVLRVGQDRVSPTLITGIFSWSAYDGQDGIPSNRDITNEKQLTDRVTLKTEYSESDTECL